MIQSNTYNLAHPGTESVVAKTHLPTTRRRKRPLLSRKGVPYCHESPSGPSALALSPAPDRWRPIKDTSLTNRTFRNSPDILLTFGRRWSRLLKAIYSCLLSIPYRDYCGTWHRPRGSRPSMILKVITALSLWDALSPSRSRMTAMSWEGGGRARPQT